MDREQTVLEFLNDKDYMPMKFLDIAAILGVPENDRPALGKILDNLVYKGLAIKSRDGKYISSESENMVNGIFSASHKGYGFIRREGDLSDIFIPPGKTKFAMNGDTVLAKITGKSEGMSDEGEIIQILCRANETVVGTVSVNGRTVFVIPDDKNIEDIYIPVKKKHKYKNGMKVVVKITKWPDRIKGAAGEIAEILGFSGDAGVDVMSVIRSHHIRTEFSSYCLNAAKKQSESIPDVTGRTDFTNELIITIDGADAKDLDDAVSLTKDGDIYRLGVHIADVSEYVTEGSALDKEAFKRGTSVYFADRVIPMLPETISNGVCSLNPHTKKLTLSVIMEIDEKGKVLNYKILKGVIKTTHRMTYEDVYHILEGDKTLCKKYSDILPMLECMKELSLILRANRQKRGSIDFDIPEPRFIFDENGYVCDIVKREMTVANHIIEEFMLICNETVAEHMFWNDIPCVYRVHQPPTEEKLTRFKNMLAPLGYTLKKSKEIHSNIFRDLLIKIEGTPEQRALSTMMLRTFMKAGYSHECGGHFGLASKYYCHFTSPIRRYPDLMVHRILKESLNGVISPKRLEALTGKTQSAAVQSSEKEIKAMEAEREIEDIKKAEFMQNFVGEVWEAVVSWVTSFGVFVEFDNTAEGLARYAEMDDDYYIFDPDNLCAVGERTKNTYKIGTKVLALIERSSPETGEIDVKILQGV